MLIRAHDVQLFCESDQGSVVSATRHLLDPLVEIKAEGHIEFTKVAILETELPEGIRAPHIQLLVIFLGFTVAI